MIPWSEKEQLLIQHLAVDACAAGSCDSASLFMKLLAAERAWQMYGEAADFSRLRSVDLRDIVRHEAWRGSEVMDRYVAELADLLVADDDGAAG